MPKLTQGEKYDLRSLIAEGFHTAFRKASDHSAAHTIWMAIRKLPDDEWSQIIDFVAEGIEPFIEKLKNAKKARRKAR